MQHKSVTFAALCLLFLLTSCGTGNAAVSENLEQTAGLSTDPYAEQTTVADYNVDYLCQGNPEIAEQVNKTLLNLPRWIRTAFQNSGWTISVVDYDLATVDYDGAYDVGDVLGSTAYSECEVRILNDPKAPVNAPVHEFGHWLDWYLGFPSMEGSEYLAIYEQEAQIYKETFGPSCSWNEQEFLAEGFWCYWRSPEALKKACPNFYQYLANNLAEIKSTQ